MRRAVFLVLVCALAAISAACGSSGGSGSDVGSGQLTVLSSVDPVAQAFDADKGHPRLILLLSPT